MRALIDTTVTGSVTTVAVDITVSKPHPLTGVDKHWCKVRVAGGQPGLPRVNREGAIALAKAAVRARGLVPVGQDGLDGAYAIPARGVAKNLYTVHVPAVKPEQATLVVRFDIMVRVPVDASALATLDIPDATTELAVITSAESTLARYLRGEGEKDRVTVIDAVVEPL